MSFRERIESEKTKRFRSVAIDDWETPFELRALQLCDKADQDAVRDILTRVDEISTRADKGHEGETDADALEENLRAFLRIVADNSDAAEAYFADYSLLDLTMAVNLYQEDTQVGAAKSRNRSRR
ncbi:hypothetical protein FPZ12_029585 [Amycolatopsis acidicola]|uniref:Uncharacterized protein n=1 Tax=Amycolatopsis acidicola TaxID=2596893 RepID=A0A5N0UX56_9PSEU|nr:phage tail assembly protein [Amycolatopsis acidicola]KAA9155550.1 hypothetical protein FPZ12_029585 [Amycolatopsis acidicola]